ncbi:MAG: molybdopterin dinucleotide binding domain-containing protein, partial [Inhella sp.]
AKLKTPGGFWLPNPAARREWRTPSGKARLLPQALPVDGVVARAKAAVADAERVLTLMTVRSHDQFNTTVYGNDDRYRNVFGTREVIFVAPEDMARLGLHAGQRVDVEGIAGIEAGSASRWLRGFELRELAIARGCAAAYFPEAAPLLPLGLVAAGARTPAAKAIPVRLHPVGPLP